MPQSPGSSFPLAEAVTPLLRTDRFGRALRGYPSVASTNTLAAEWAREDAPEGALVLTDFQTAGRGRLGRAWEAQAGVNLMGSLVLRPTLPPEHLGLITLAAAVAVAETVESVTSALPVQIKWPNDVLLNGRKCCGMLLEAPHGRAAEGAVVLGIGLNVNQTTFPPALSETATSLLLATGRPMARAPLLAVLLGHLEARYDSLHADGGTRVRRAYTDRLHRLHQTVRLRPAAASDEVVEGIVDGISAGGALQLRTDVGLQTFHAGDVTTRLG